MQDLKYLGFGACAGAVFLVLCLLLLRNDGLSIFEAQARIDQPKKQTSLTANQYVKQMGVWSKSNKITQAAEPR